MVKGELRWTREGELRTKQLFVLSLVEATGRKSLIVQIVQTKLGLGGGIRIRGVEWWETENRPPEVPRCATTPILTVRGATESGKYWANTGSKSYAHWAPVPKITPLSLCRNKSIQYYIFIAICCIFIIVIKVINNVLVPRESALRFVKVRFVAVGPSRSQHLSTWCASQPLNPQP